MCYSAEVSFATWGFAMVSAAYLFLNKMPFRSFVFPLVVSQMQLIEGLRWINAIDENILAVLAKIALYSQPIAGLYQIKETSYILPYILAQSTIELLVGSRDLRFVVGGDGHFVWKWLNRDSILFELPYWITLIYSTYKLFPLPLFLLLSGLYFYYKYEHSKYKTEGSLWCVSVNIMWIYFLLKSMPMK